jgi:flavodoxin
VGRCGADAGICRKEIEMENIIFYFSGTGNSLKAAKTIAKGLDNTEIAPMGKPENRILTKQYNSIGFVYPVYFWGLPNAVVKFITNIKFSANSYYYTISTSSGSPGNGLSQLNELLKKHHTIKLSYGKNIVMQTNYILHNYLFYIYSFHNLNEKVEKILKKADKKIIKIIEEIKQKENNKI